MYECSKAVDEYLQMHFATQAELCPYDEAPVNALEFPKRCADVCIEAVMHAGAQGPLRALDIGCAVGRSSFELSRYFDEVTGIDFSNAFIEAANKMKANGSAEYDCAISGNFTEKRVAKVPQAARPDRITFQQGDACNLPDNLGQFDVMMAANLICRLPDPKAYFDRMPSLIKKGGFVVLISPHSWLEEYTPKDKWLGGYEKDGKFVDTFDTMKELMAPNFDFLYSKNMPFFIREHVRKFQWGVSHCAVWKRK